MWSFTVEETGVWNRDQAPSNRRAHRPETDRARGASPRIALAPNPGTTKTEAGGWSQQEWSEELTQRSSLQ